MKKSIFNGFLAFLVVYATQITCVAIPTLESIYATTITHTDATTTRSIYDYLHDLKQGQQPEGQDLLLSKRKQTAVHIEPGVNCPSTACAEPVFVFSASFLPEPVKTPGKLDFYWPGSPGRALYEAGYYFINKSMGTTCVTFEYPDARTQFNFGQELDQKCLKMVTDEVIEQGHQFILFGKCRGATNILNFLTQQPKEYLAKNGRAVIIESVPLSLKHLCEQSMRALPILNWFYWLSDKKATAALYTFFRAAMPNHRYEDTTLLNNLNNIPSNLPILIVHLLKDTVVFDQDIKTLLQKLLETGHTNVHLLLFDDSELNHYTIAKAPIYGLAINAFLKQYQLPHRADHVSQHTMLTTPLACPTGMSEKAYIDEIWSTCAIKHNGRHAPRKIS